MADYIILEATNIYALRKEVNEYLKLGYKPVGNMTATAVNTDPGFLGMNDIEKKYYQPMLKEEENF